MTLPSRPATSGLRLADVVLPLSVATDIGTGESMDKALRACLLALRLGESLGLDGASLNDLYYLTLLRYLGCTSGGHLAAVLFGDEHAFRARTLTVDYSNPLEMLGAIAQFVGADRPPVQRGALVANALAALARHGRDFVANHCEGGQRLAAQLGMSADVQVALGQVYERWDGKGLPNNLKGDNIPLILRVANLAHTVASFYHLGGAQAAVTMAQEWAGGALDPDLVDQFRSDAGRLCQSLEIEPVWAAVREAEPGPCRGLSPEQQELALEAVADFADLKTPYTVGHSRGVARLAAEAARRSGIPESGVMAVRQAAYVHDIGRVGVPTLIWDKPGPLTDAEWETVRLHPYYTERLLARSELLASLGTLGATHHERLDGSGYHRRLPATMLSPLARILGAADVYRALREIRPHRPAQPPEAAAETLRAEVRAGRLDGDAVAAVLGTAGHHASPEKRAWVAGLTEREVEVLRLLARGQSNRQIAQRLSISKETAGHHVRHIYDKIDVSTRAAATLFAMQHNLLDDS